MPACIVIIAIFLAAGPAWAGSKKKATAPLPEGADVVWQHAPYGVGECSICHKNSDPKKPGPINKPVVELCYTCHVQIKENLESHQYTHFPVEESCVNCHNPHNSRYRKLLLSEAPKLCFGCHEEVEALATKSATKHGALTIEQSCLNCHNAHSSNIEFQLNALPFDLCIGCHDKDDVKDDTGKALTNMKKLLDENPVKHGPVEKKDCSACHNPHGSENMRLLKLAYPAKFYSPFEPENYALCFRCHNDRVLQAKETTTLTKFRKGKLNLHYKHVNKPERGRTCRACHEVHAAKRPHQIREGVPYGTSGWMLPINFTPKPGGGECTKTCHSTKSYNNGLPR